MSIPLSKLREKFKKLVQSPQVDCEILAASLREIDEGFRFNLLGHNLDLLIVPAGDRVNLLLRPPAIAPEFAKDYWCSTKDLGSSYLIGLLVRIRIAAETILGRAAKMANKKCCRFLLHMKSDMEENDDGPGWKSMVEAAERLKARILALPGSEMTLDLFPSEMKFGEGRVRLYGYVTYEDFSWLDHQDILSNSAESGITMNQMDDCVEESE